MSTSIAWPAEKALLLSCSTAEGSISASLSWRTSIGAIAGNYRVFAPDLPGYGNSDRPRVEYSNDYYVEFLGDLYLQHALP